MLSFYKVIKLRVYSSEDMNLISQAQAVALCTALPIVLIIFKNFFKISDHNEQKLEEYENLTFEEINYKVKNDPYLVNANHIIPDEFIEKGIKGLIEIKFLKQYRNGLRLTESGLKAVKLLLVMDTNSR